MSESWVKNLKDGDKVRHARLSPEQAIVYTVCWRKDGILALINPGDGSWTPNPVMFERDFIKVEPDWVDTLQNGDLFRHIDTSEIYVLFTKYDPTFFGFRKKDGTIIKVSTKAIRASFEKINTDQIKKKQIPEWVSNLKVGDVLEPRSVNQAPNRPIKIYGAGGDSVIAEYIDKNGGFCQIMKEGIADLFALVQSDMSVDAPSPLSGEVRGVDPGGYYAENADTYFCKVDRLVVTKTTTEVYYKRFGERESSMTAEKFLELHKKAKIVVEKKQNNSKN